MNQQDLLTALVDATQQNSFLYTSEQDRANLDPVFVDTNPDMVDPNDPSRIATRATPAGVTFMNAKQVETTSPPKSDFEIESNVPLPKATRQSRTAKYPIEQLEVGQCFHVSTTDMSEEDAEKTFRAISTLVSQANARHRADKQPIEKETIKKRHKNKETGEWEESLVEQNVTVQLKQFTSRRVSSDDPKGAGLRVFRVAVE